MTDQVFERNSLVVIDYEDPFKKVNQLFADILSIVDFEVFQTLLNIKVLTVQFNHF